MERLVDIDSLSISFPSSGGDVLAVRDCSFSIGKGEVLGLVGESGCGKTVTAYSILNLVPPPGKVAGRILMDGVDLLSLSPEEMRGYRGRRISMIFQEPMTSLNPVFNIGYQMRESIMLHLGMKRKEASQYAASLLDRVGIPNATKRLSSFPHEFSGGQRQRIMIAMALSTSPELLIADEPTTALDVTIQAQILELLLELHRDEGMSLLFITHDLGVVAGLTDRVAIMYAGEIVDYGPTGSVFSRRYHPYTTGLLEAVPVMEGDAALSFIPGTVPTLREATDFCVFEPRCAMAQDRCKREKNMLREIVPGHSTRCLLAR